MFKIVYLILSHTNPDQVYRLIRTLKQGSKNSYIVVNHDNAKSDLNLIELPNVKDVKIIKSEISSGWGEFSLVERVIDSLSWIYSRLKFNWLVFISGQDYPIQPIKKIEEFLDKTNFDGFIRGVALSSEIPCGENECSKSNISGIRCIDCEERYYFQYVNFSYRDSLPPFFLQRIEKIGRYINQKQNHMRIRSFLLQNGISKKVGFRSSKLFFDSEFECYKGSQWFNLNYKCTQYIMEFIRQNPQFVRYYKKTIIPDESFFQTILFNNNALNICNDNLRFISWKNENIRSPDTLTLADLNQLVFSKDHFARKFDINEDEKILDRIDQQILNN